MKIRKKLKNAEFEYDGVVELNKVYAFAFMRFVVRMAQRNWLRSKKPLDKDSEDVVQYNNQLEMF